MFKEYQNIHHMLLTFQCLKRFIKLFDKFTNKNNSVISWISNGDKPNRGLCGQHQEKLSNSYLVCFKNKRNFWNFTNDYKEDLFKALDILALHTKKFLPSDFQSTEGKMGNIVRLPTPLPVMVLPSVCYFFPMETH
jgi:hypothetical protein